MRRVTATILALGFLLGMRHATDPDHVIAVSTIIARHRTVAAGVVVGALWGLGHSLTIVAVGAVLVAFRIVVPPALGLTMELGVAVMLVILGVSNVVPPRTGERLDQRLDRVARYPVFRPIVIGLVHGLAGSATIVLLVMTAISDPRAAVAYLVLFGLGTIVGMTLVTLAVAAPLTFAAARLPRLQRQLRTASGMLSVAFGLFLAYHVGFVNGLFTGQAGWTAR